MKIYILSSVVALFTTMFVSGQNLTLSQKNHMIDSAFDARTDRYLRRCFPDYAINIKYDTDSFSLCSIETVLLVAPNISEAQIPVLEKFMIRMANYYVSINEPLHFDYGFIPADINDNFNRMFKSRQIYVGSPDGAESHPRVNHLLSVFNRITDGYINRSVDVK